MSDSATNAIIGALHETLQRLLPQKCEAPDVGRAHWVFDPLEMNAAKAPAVGIFDGGTRKLYETTRGRDPETGKIQAGMTLQEHRVDVQVFCKGYGVRDNQAAINEWRDAVVAALEDDPTLGGVAAEALTDDSEPTMEFGEGSTAFRSGIVRCTIKAWRQAGSTKLLEAI